ncbi:MAG: hypothetical protein CFH16_00738 [Alphaproteobacteria bacterium MarineAlpha5_Bin6]|nr:MAG: hypothetical protein CFH17_01089 [Alphaproteobacteria bacterium MarineAlpha5_Bin7]PPR53920.1 MAG: hypothetical protein CFH16_00738 [Alphaproteobacteria bacterium MarineAlpha5_Bin6]
MIIDFLYSLIIGWIILFIFWLIIIGFIWLRKPPNSILTKQITIRSISFFIIVLLIMLVFLLADSF